MSTIIKVILFILGLFKKPKIEDRIKWDAHKDKEDRHEEAEELYQQIIDKDQEIKDVTIHMLTAQSLNLHAKHHELDSDCRVLEDTRGDLIKQWEHVTGHTFERRGDIRSPL